MLDIDLEDELVRKVGGKFALTYLLQKRMVQLNRGEPPLIEMEEGEELDNHRIVCQEILQGKIVLAPRDQIQHAQEEPKKITQKPEDDDSGGEVYGSDIKKIKEQRIRELSQLLNPNTKD